MVPYTVVLGCGDLRRYNISLMFQMVMMCSREGMMMGVPALAQEEGGRS